MDKNIVTPIKFDNDMVTILDQTRLPNEVVYIKLKNVEDVYDAIIKLKIRGAPAIGIAGAYGLFIVARNSKASIVEEMLDEIKSMGDYLISSRPTAVNLEWAIKRVISKLKVELFKSTKEVVALVLEEAQQIHMEDEET